MLWVLPSLERHIQGVAACFGSGVAAHINGAPAQDTDQALFGGEAGGFLVLHLRLLLVLESA